MRNKEENIAELLKIADEIIVQYVPTLIWEHCKKLPGQYVQGRKDILSLEILRFFKKFNINESIAQRFLVKRKRVPLNVRLVNNRHVLFLVNFDEDDELTDMLKELKPIIGEVSIRFIGRGNIAPALNKIGSCLHEKTQISAISANKDGLDIGLSKGIINGFGRVELENFYCKDKSEIVFSNLQNLVWTKSGNLMRNIGDCFPAVQILSIEFSKSDSLNIAQMKKTLTGLHLRKFNWKPSFNQDLAKLDKLTRLSMANCNVKVFPEAILSLTKLRFINLSRNHFSTLPVSFSDLKELYTLILEHNEIEDFPVGLELTHLQDLRLGGNQIKNIDISLDKNPKLRTIMLNKNDFSELSGKFISEIFKNNISISFSGNTKIKLPDITEIEISENSKNGIVYLHSCNIDEQTRSIYENKYPDRFKFRY